MKIISTTYTLDYKLITLPLIFYINLGVPSIAIERYYYKVSILNRHHQFVEMKFPV